MILVAPIAALVFIFSVRSAYGARYQNEQAEDNDDQLHIFAATFNTANADSKAYSVKQTIELLQALTDGHEDLGEEADLVILGFQEFKDQGSSFSFEAKHHLWQKLSEKKMEEVEEGIKDILTLKDHVKMKEIEDKILEDSLAFHSKWGDQLEKSEKQYHNFTVVVEQLIKMVQTRTEAPWIRNAMKPIHQLFELRWQAITHIRDRYPSMKYTSIGKGVWTNLLAYVDRVKTVEANLIQNKKQQTRQVDDTLAADIDEQEISRRLDNDLMAVKEAVATLNKDIMNLVPVTSSKHSAEIFSDLLHQPSFHMFPNQYEVPVGIHKFQSGPGCNLVKHYDTMLYVFVNPWSEWNISAINYSSDTCKPGSSASTNTGCSIDNNKLGECGKVVNMQVLQAQKGHKSIRVCALNTHMSFAGEASTRMQQIKAAALEAKSALCDTIVFVGDFNSRMHCDHSATSTPPSDRLDVNTNSSFQYMVDKVCPGGKCTLRGLDESIMYYDELMQMMEAPNISCWEKQEQIFRKASWENIETKNELMGLNLFEANVPNFAPTYKVGPASAARKLPNEWHFCPDLDVGEESCFLNEKKSDKHNPSWTDRILLWPSEGTKAIPKATAYLRRSIDVDLGSDHVPVVAKVKVSVL